MFTVVYDCVFDKFDIGTNADATLRASDGGRNAADVMAMFGKGFVGNRLAGWLANAASRL